MSEISLHSAIRYLRQSAYCAGLADDDMPSVRLTFPSVVAKERFKSQVAADFKPYLFDTLEPIGVAGDDIRLEGINIKFEVGS